ncbi:tetratricopeptide repeat protein [Primorskyibacter sp. S87]|uniref:tetratricopeptide repeat protein n=1 Tax=Primorskyibacter sp. S87 TaxID=3415126 RepID=UPI003C7C01B4
MALKDRYDNPLGTSVASARDSYVDGVDKFLAAEFGAVEDFARAVAEDPGFAIAHAGHARALMMSADMPAAREAIARAEALQSGCSARERSHITAFSLLLAGKAAECRAHVLAHAQDYPRDALAVQLCTSVFGLIGFSGKAGREAELLAFTSRLLPHYGEDWWMLSMHALSLCETGQLSASMTMMERALALNPRNANAAHFKAHAQYEAGETVAGLAYLKDWMVPYDNRALMHGHLSWHTALWALHEGDIATMWEWVDRGVAPGASLGMPINVLTDTAAILYRAELAGVEVEGDRWSALSDYAARFFPNAGQSFADMHAALSHGMAGNGERLAVLAETETGFAGDLVAPVARAWSAIARNDWTAARDDLIPVLASSERLGGSRAQRDLLELTYANILMKLGNGDEARRVLSMRRPVFDAGIPVIGLQ